MRRLATIRIIQQIEPIKGKDRVEMATVDGWTCMVSKSDHFKPGDLCIFCEPDSVFPAIDQWEFLKRYNYRIKTQKFKDGDGCTIYSQGLVLPLSTLDNSNKLKVGDEVTDLLGITQYEETMDIEPVATTKHKYPAWLMKYKWFRKLVTPNDNSTKFPDFISKTDEERIQNCPDMLNIATKWVATEKIDGQSGTFIVIKHKKVFWNRYEFIVCSRNKRILHDDGSTYWKVARKYNIEEVLKQFLRNNPTLNWVAIQGECISPKVQGNKYKVKQADLFVFNLKDSKHDRWDTLAAAEELQYYKLNFVPILGVCDLTGMTVKDVLNMSNGVSKLHDTIREGIVFRSIDGKLSFKAVSPVFLDKYNQ